MEDDATIELSDQKEIDEPIRTDLPFLIDRIKALFIDVFVLVFLMLIFSLLFEAMNYTGKAARIFAYAFIWLYEPVLVALGGTLGHRIMKMRVRRASNESKNIMLHMAILRVIVKSLLGWISLLTVPQNKNKKAIHDMASGSIMIKMGSN